MALKRINKVCEIRNSEMKERKRKAFSEEKKNHFFFVLGYLGEILFAQFRVRNRSDRMIENCANIEHAKFQKFLFSGLLAIFCSGPTSFETGDLHKNKPK